MPVNFNAKDKKSLIIRLKTKNIIQK